MAPVANAGKSVPHQPMGEETEHVNQRILSKTSFESTQVAATFHKYLDALSAIPALDERMGFNDTFDRNSCALSLPAAGEWRCILLPGLTIHKVYGGSGHTGEGRIDD